MFLFRLLAALNRERFECSVISLLEPGPVGMRIRELGVEVRSLGLKRGAVSPAGLVRLTRWLRQDRPDLLMTWLYHADLLGLMAGKLAGVRDIAWNLRAADMDMSRYRSLSGWIRRLGTKLSCYPSAVIVNSERGKSFHAEIGYRPRAWVLIRNGVDPSEFKPDDKARDCVRSELGLRSQDTLAGLVARFDPMKDHANFIAAAKHVAQADNTVHFAFAGKGMDNHNRELAAALDYRQLAGRVHLLGERRDVPRFTAALDIACSASRSEAFPNTVVEAMACGVVCVATDAGDTRQILGDEGIIVPRGDPEALAQGLLHAIAMGSAKRLALGRAARERVLQNFTMERSVREYENFFARFGV